MSTITIIILGSLAIIFGLVWRARIRRSKRKDPDHERREAAMKKELED